MIICICNNVSDKDINNYINTHSNDFNLLIEDLSCCNQCQTCTYAIQDIINQNSKELLVCQ